MKFRIVLALVAMLATYSSCIKHATNAPQIEAVDTFSPYKVQQYSYDGANQTSMYTGYNIQFGTAGQVVANNNGITSQGEWSTSGGKITILNFAGAPLSLLNNTWTIESNVNKQLQLSAVSNGKAVMLVLQQ